MPSKRNNSKRNNRKSGAGYLSPAEFFNPEARQPSSTEAPMSSEPVPGWIRPPMTATTVMSPNVKTGGKRASFCGRTARKSRKNRRSTRKSGGFAPALMGNFVSNAHAAVVPLVLAGMYHYFGRPANKTAKAVSTLKSKKGGNCSRRY